MFGGTQERELEARCLVLVQDGERHRREIGEAVREIQGEFRWVGTVASAAKSSGPVLMGVAGLAGVLLGRGGKGGLLSWVSRLQVGLKAFRIIRQFLRETR